MRIHERRCGHLIKLGTLVYEAYGVRANSIYDSKRKESKNVYT